MVRACGEARLCGASLRRGSAAWCEPTERLGYVLRAYGEARLRGGLGEDVVQDVPVDIGQAAVGTIVIEGQLLVI